MPPGNFVAQEAGTCALSRALTSSLLIFCVTFLQLAPEFLSFTFFSGICLCILTSQFGASRSADVLHFFSSPPRTGKRGFLDLKFRGHFETLCCGYDSDLFQILLPSVASMPFWVFFLRSRYLTGYSGYAWSHSNMMASWRLCRPCCFEFQ